MTISPRPGDLATISLRPDDDIATTWRPGDLAMISPRPCDHIATTW
ncbi:MAG: hypothetical protein GY832_30720 [Chloroflexi bacterium]|nr:hypothetical protein [Chloroflexota bacterium]